MGKGTHLACSSICGSIQVQSAAPIWFPCLPGVTLECRTRSYSSQVWLKNNKTKGRRGNVLLYHNYFPPRESVCLGSQGGI